MAVDAAYTTVVQRMLARRYDRATPMRALAEDLSGEFSGGGDTTRRLSLSNPISGAGDNSFAPRDYMEATAQGADIRFQANNRELTIDQNKAMPPIYIDRLEEQRYMVASVMNDMARLGAQALAEVENDFAFETLIKGITASTVIDVEENVIDQVSGTGFSAGAQAFHYALLNAMRDMAYEARAANWYVDDSPNVFALMGPRTYLNILRAMEALRMTFQTPVNDEVLRSYSAGRLFDWSIIVDNGIAPMEATSVTSDTTGQYPMAFGIANRTLSRAGYPAYEDSYKPQGLIGTRMERAHFYGYQRFDDQIVRLVTTTVGNQ